MGADQPAPYVAPLRVYREPRALRGDLVRRRGSAWTGDFLFACLRGRRLRRLVLRGDTIVRDEPLFQAGSDACARWSRAAARSTCSRATATGAGCRCAATTASCASPIR